MSAGTYTPARCPICTGPLAYGSAQVTSVLLNFLSISYLFFLSTKFFVYPSLSALQFYYFLHRRQFFLSIQVPEGHSQMLDPVLYPPLAVIKNSLRDKSHKPGRGCHQRIFEIPYGKQILFRRKLADDLRNVPVLLVLQIPGNVLLRHLIVIQT